MVDNEVKQRGYCTTLNHNNRPVYDFSDNLVQQRHCTSKCDNILLKKMAIAPVRPHASPTELGQQVMIDARGHHVIY